MVGRGRTPGLEAAVRHARERVDAYKIMFPMLEHRRPDLDAEHFDVLLRFAEAQVAREAGPDLKKIREAM